MRRNRRGHRERLGEQSGVPLVALFFGEIVAGEPRVRGFIHPRRGEMRLADVHSLVQRRFPGQRGRLRCCCAVVAGGRGGRWRRDAVGGVVISKQPCRVVRILSLVVVRFFKMPRRLTELRGVNARRHRAHAPAPPNGHQTLSPKRRTGAYARYVRPPRAWHFERKS